MANEEDRKYPQPGLAVWEQKLATVIAKKFEVLEPEELQAELFRTVLEIKTRAPAGVLDWERYLAKALHNKAHNWTRDRRRRRGKETALPEPDQETSTSFAASEASPDSIAALAEFRRILGRELTELWDVLAASEGNVTEAARRLGMHRNTVRRWIGRIRRILTAHGLQPDVARGKTLTKTSSSQKDYVVLSSRLSQSLARGRLSGTQWRIVLWVLRESRRLKKRTIPCHWSRIAEELSLDRSATWRAGRFLLRTNFLYIRSGRIGLKKDMCRRRPTST